MQLCEGPCPACGADRARAYDRVAGECPDTRGPWKLVECDGCASVYLRPRPVDPSQLYGPGYHVHRPAEGVGGRLKAALAASAARDLARRLPAAAHVLELGCGTGDLLFALARRGCRVRGVELSPSAVLVARSRGLDVVCGDYLRSGAEDASQDAVVAAHVLEHVVDPIGFLAEVARLLRPGGVAMLKTPLAHGWDAHVFGGASGSCDVPYHMFVPTAIALSGLAAAVGLREIELKHDPVPNDWVHGLRRVVAVKLKLQRTPPWMSPYNPFLALAFLPIAAVAAWLGRAGRVRWWLRRP